MRGKEGAGRGVGQNKVGGNLVIVSVPLRGKEGAGLNPDSANWRANQPVSVPLRGKEGAGRFRFGDLQLVEGLVSVPLRGKEGAGLFVKPITPSPLAGVSVPLRGKEGAGQSSGLLQECWAHEFPSPCGVRRVRDERLDINGHRDKHVRFRPLAG